MKLTETAIERLRAIKPVIVENAHAFIMSDWVATKYSWRFREEVREPEKNVCDSAACIGGTLVAFHDNVNLLKMDSIEIQERVQELLEQPDFPQLFSLTSWPDDLYHRYQRATTDLERAIAACRAIDQYIETPESFSEENEDERYAVELDEDEDEDEEYDDEDDEDEY